MEVLTSNQYGNLSYEKLVEFEEQLNVTLPEDYRNYLIQYNGGLPKTNHFCIKSEGGDSRIHHVYGLNVGPDFQRLDLMFKIYTGRVSKSVLPIADDPFGNLICIGINNDIYGKIYFWDHEKEHNYNDTQQMEELSTSFTDFLLTLHECTIVDDEIVKAIKENDLVFISNAMNRGYDIDTEDEYGLSMIEKAAMYNMPEVIQFLHERGADLRNALDYAVDNAKFFPKHKDSVELIKKLVKQKGTSR